MPNLMDFTPIALKNLFSKPATRNYPAEAREYPKRSRGHVENDIDTCILCGICQKKCPSDAIKVDRNAGTWEIDRMGCVQCQNCVNGCPKKCLSIVPGYTTPSSEKIVDRLEKPQEPKAEDTSSNDGTVNNDMSSCVLCGLCQRNCPQNAITVDRTETKTWTINHDDCVKCGMCLDKCPKKCLTMDGDSSGTQTLTKE